MSDLGSLDQKLRRVAEFIKLGAERSRAEVVMTLATQTLDSKGLCEEIGIESPAALAKHLLLLRLGNIITGHRRKTNVFYELTDPGRQLLKLLQAAADVPPDILRRD